MSCFNISGEKKVANLFHQHVYLLPLLISPVISSSVFEALLLSSLQPQGLSSYGFRLLLRIVCEDLLELFQWFGSTFQVRYLDVACFPGTRWLNGVLLSGSFLLEGQRFQRFQLQDRAAPSTASLYAFFFSCCQFFCGIFLSIRQVSTSSSMSFCNSSSRAGTSFAFTSWIVVTNFLLYLQGQLLGSLLGRLSHQLFHQQSVNQLVFEAWGWIDLNQVQVKLSPLPPSNSTPSIEPRVDQLCHLLLQHLL